MRSPTAALLWEIWRQHRWTVAAIAGLTAAGRVVDDPLATLFAMAAFLLLFTVFNYTEAASEAPARARHDAGARGVGQFPRRLFTLPVTSLRLVAVPTLAGIASIELLYLLWMGPLLEGGSASAPFVAVLFAALVVFYLWIFWVLERAGSLRLLVFGITAFAVFVLGMLPSFPPTPAPVWRSEIMLGSGVAALAMLAFLQTWHYVARLRGGGPAHATSLLNRRIEIAAPVRRTTFASAESAHLWFEWRSSGMVLPILVGGVVLLGILPISWLVQSDARYTSYLLLMALASPIVLAIPVGIAFCKPVFWSEDLALLSFVAVRPISTDDLIAIKVKVAALSAVVSWLVLLVPVTIWLSTWASLDSVSQVAISLWAFHGRSVAAVYGIAALVVLAGMCMTWRLLVSRLWSGLSGKRPLFVGSVVATFALVIAGLVFDVYRLPGWLLGDPARLGPIVWAGALLVIAKYWAAAWAWRGVAWRYLRAYLLLWLGSTMAFLAAGFVLWGMVRIYLPIDGERSRSLVIILALLATPLARVALARSALERNRHRVS
jgi:hypothetical protein